MADIFRNIAASRYARVHAGYVLLGETRYPITIQEAQELRDWLTQALPCLHDGRKTGFGDTSGRMRETCDKCGAVTIDVPGSGT